MNNVGVKIKPPKIFFSDINALPSLENTFIPPSHKNYTVNQNNSSGIKCGDEFGEHEHQK